MADTMTESFNQAVANDVIANRTEAATTETTASTEAATTETAPVTTTETTTVETPNEWWKEVGAESAEVVKEKYTGYDTLKQEYETLKASPPTVQPYKNELSKFIDNLPQGVDPKFAVQYFDVKPETLTDEQAWKLNEKFTNPYKSEEEINAKFDSKFRFEDESLATDSEKLLKSGALKEESFSAKNALKEFIGKTLNPVAPEVAQKEREQATAKLMQEWSSKIPSVANNLKEVARQVPVKMFGSDEAKMVDFKYQMPETEQKAILDESYKIAIQYNVVPDEQGLKTINEIATNLLWQRNGEKIAHAMVSEATSKLLENFKQIINNPNLAATHQTQTNADRYTPAEQAVINSMKKGL